MKKIGVKSQIKVKQVHLIRDQMFQCSGSDMIGGLYVKTVVCCDFRKVCIHLLLVGGEQSGAYKKDKLNIHGYFSEGDHVCRI